MKNIYKITNPNGHIYIGQTKNINKRKHDYKKGNCKSQCKLHNSIIKYGWDNHMWEIIEENIESLDMANEREIYWIAYYNSTVYGLNILPGGNIRVFSEESKQKMRLAKLGKKHSAEHIENNRLSKLGHIVSDETKNKISNSRISLFEKKSKVIKEKTGLTEEGRQKIIKSRLGKKHTPETILKMKQRIPWNKGKKD